MSTPITSTEKKRRFFIMAGFAFVAVAIILFVSFYIFAPAQAPSTANLASAKRENVSGQVGGQGSEEYNKKLETHNSQQANAALTAGESYIPTPVGKPSLITKKTDSPPPAPPQVVQPRVAQTKTQQRDNGLLKRMMEDLAQLDTKLASYSTSGGAIVYTTDFEADQRKARERGGAGGKPSAPAVAGDEQPQVMTDLKPGDLLYAIVDTGINSDVPSAVMATIVQGKYNKARVLGSFKRFEERMVLAFTRCILPSGESIQIDAFGVDPATTEGSVASSVDTHFFSRWGGLVASAFLEGLGTAKRYSGASSTVYGGGYNGNVNDQMVWNKYSLEDQAWIAAGKVGEKAGKIYEKNFDRPPTVYLASGSAVGILVMNVKENKAGKK